MPDHSSLKRRPFIQASLTGALGLSPLAAAAQSSSAQPSSSDANRLKNAIAQTDKLTQSLQKNSGIPGIAVAIVQGDETVFAKGYGICREGSSEPVNADTVFQLASVSKPVGATVVAHQVGLGKVSWASKMHELLPWFKLSNPAVSSDVEIADLYAHRSGLPDHVGDLLEEIGYDRIEIMHRLDQVKIDGFRKKYAYTNLGLTSAAQAVAVNAGKDWSALSEAVLYQPLGMSRTTSRYEEFMAMSNRAAGHVIEEGKFTPTNGRASDAQSPAGGVSSSVNDMAKWMSLTIGKGRFKGRQIVEEAALTPALSPQMLISPAHDGQPASYYGYGINVGTSDGGHKMLSHSGAFLMGAATNVMMLPELNIGIVVLTNAWPLGVAEAIGLTFLDYVQFGAPQKDWLKLIAPIFAQLLAPEGELAGKSAPANPAPAQNLSVYTGKYQNSYYGPLAVSKEDGALILTAGPSKIRYHCTHLDGDDFVIRPGGESSPPGSAYKVSFSGTPVKRLDCDFFKEEGLSSFTR